MARSSEEWRDRREREECDDALEFVLSLPFAFWCSPAGAGSRDLIIGPSFSKARSCDA